MATHNANNERIKRKYFAYLKEAKRQSEATIDQVAKALSRFEEDTGHRDFKTFRVEQAIAFKKRLAQQNGAGGRQLSKATLYATLAHLRRFFHWLAGQPGYRSRLRYSDSDYFNLSEKDMRVATARREKASPTLEQVQYVLANMPSGNEIEKRDRALVAFTLLTGARDSAIASMKVKHIDLAGGKVYQDAREVNTKFSKSFATYFFPVGLEIREIVTDWVTYLRQVKLWGTDAPLFPATELTVGKNQRFEVTGLKPEHWRSTGPIRGIFREAFTRAGLPYFNPHSLRNTLVELGEKVCQTPEEFKAWSQNLGHEKVLTTFLSYGEVAGRRQQEIMHCLFVATQSPLRTPADEVAEKVMEKLAAAGLAPRRKC